MNLPLFRRDSDVGLYHTRELEKRETSAFKREMADTNTASMNPTTYDLGFGAQSEVKYFADEVGEAAIVSGNPDDVPLVEVFESKEETPVLTTMVGYSYAFTELDAMEQARSNGRTFTGNLPTLRMETAARAMKTKEHIIGCYGAPNHNHYGLFNNPNIPLYDESTLDVYDPTTTAEDLHTWFVTTLHSTIKENTLLIEQPTSIIMPDKLMTRLSDTFRAGSAGDATAMDLIERTLRRLGVREFISRNEVQSDWLEKYGVHSPGTNKDMMMIYDKNIRKIKRSITNVRPIPWSYENGRYKRLFYQRLGVTYSPYPLSALYVTFPKPS